MTQESETCSKAQFIHGHLFGALGVVARRASKRFCIPLKFNIQDGLRDVSSWAETKGIVDISGSNHIEQMVEAAFEASNILGKSYLLLDRYFLSKTALRLLDKLNLEAGSDEGNLVEIITKAKINCAAFMKPLPKKPGIRGRPPKKGKPIHLWELFDCQGHFTDVWVYLYGKRECVSYYGINLLWRQGLYKELRFILVKRQNGKKSILVSTDLTLRPKHIKSKRVLPGKKRRAV